MTAPAEQQEKKWTVRSNGETAWICEVSGKIICDGLFGNAAIRILHFLSDAHNATLSEPKEKEKEKTIAEQCAEDLGIKEPPSESVKATGQNTLPPISEWYEAIRLLHDYQNGCPLPSYANEWGRAMDECVRLITIYERAAPSVVAGVSSTAVGASSQNLSGGSPVSGAASEETYECPHCQGKLTHYELHHQTRCWHCDELLAPPPSTSLQPSETQEDTKRLDWLDQQREPISLDGETLLAYLWQIEAQNYDIRSAIDAAMASSVTAYKQEEKTNE